MDESDEGTTSLSKVSVKPVVLVRGRGRLTRGELIPSGPPEAAILQFYSPQLCINLVLVKREEFSSSYYVTQLNSAFTCCISSLEKYNKSSNSRWYGAVWE
jgi:hypothetical protein